MGIDTFWDLFWGYSAIWAVISGYIVVLFRDQRMLRRRVEALESKIEHSKK